MAGRRPGSPNDFRVGNAGVAIAVFLFLAACIGFIAVMVVAGQRARNTRIAVNFGDESTPASAFATLDLPDGGEIAAASARDDEASVRGHPAAVSEHTGAVRRSHPNLPMPNIMVNGKSITRGTTTFAAPEAVRGEKVLVISDVVPYPAAAEQAIQRLQAAGFKVLGNFPGNKAEEVDLQSQLDLEAAAKQVRGLSPLTTDDTQQALGEWVASEELGLLVWFSRVDPGKPAVQAHLFSPMSAPGADDEEKDAARAAMMAGVRAMKGE
jgi:hypothetical protein